MISENNKKADRYNELMAKYDVKHASMIMKWISMGNRTFSIGKYGISLASLIGM